MSKKSLQLVWLEKGFELNLKILLQNENGKYQNPHISLSL
jgi:hypothetical protein